MVRLRAVRESSSLRYALGAAAVAIAAAMRISITPVFGDRNELLFFYPAIVVTAWFGGFGPALVSTALSAVTAIYLFMEPKGSLLLVHRSDALAVSLFIAIGVIIASLSENLRRAVLQERLARRLAEQAQAEAAAANRSKDFFLAAVSHDLRTPTTAIVGWAQMLEQGALDVARQRHAAASIRRNAARQITLLEDLLDSAAILAGGFRIDKLMLDVVPIVRAAVDDVEGTAAAKRIQLRLVPPPEPAIVNGDAMRLQQVIWNLLTNAIKFTPEEGAVDVIIRGDATAVRIDVHDTGPGVAPEVIPHVFDRFWQADRSDQRGSRGVGLGLAIAKQLVQAHDGTISATSVGQGRGTTFTVRLPRLATAALMATAAPRTSAAWQHGS